jgi:hypothetical protein
LAPTPLVIGSASHVLAAMAKASAMSAEVSSTGSVSVSKTSFSMASALSGFSLLALASVSSAAFGSVVSPIRRLPSGFLTFSGVERDSMVRLWALGSALISGNREGITMATIAQRAQRGAQAGSLRWERARAERVNATSRSDLAVRGCAARKVPSRERGELSFRGQTLHLSLRFHGNLSRSFDKAADDLDVGGRHLQGPPL